MLFLTRPQFLACKWESGRFMISKLLPQSGFLVQPPPLDLVSKTANRPLEGWQWRACSPLRSEVNPDTLKEAENHVVTVGGAWVSVLALPLTCCVTSGKSRLLWSLGCNCKMKDLYDPFLL